MKDTSLNSPKEMAKIAEDIATYKANKTGYHALLNAIPAGAFIAIAFVFYATTQTGAGMAPWGLVKLVGGLVFSLGVIMVVVCGSDLFTSTNMTLIARVAHRVSLGKMFSNWVVVYLGNFIGALFIVALTWYCGQVFVANGQWGLTILQTAQHKIHHTWIEAFSLGIFCNIMVCIGIWMSYAGRTLTDKILALMLPISMFVASGFEHSVANMFMIPMGIITAQASSTEFWQIVQLDPMQFADLTIYNFIVNNAIPVTLGNIIGGGICVGLMQWWINRPKENTHD